MSAPPWEDPAGSLSRHLRDWESRDLSDAELLTDALATLRHFADVYGLDFADCDAMAYRHYLAERSAPREVAP